MRKALFLLAAAAAFGLSPLAGELGPIGGSALLLALGVAFAFAASGALTSLAAAGGALGAFASAVLGGASPALGSAAAAGALGGAALTSLAFAERTSRVRGGQARLTHAGMALVAGAVAGAVAASYASAPAAVRGVAVLVAAVLAALPLLIDADDSIAHALDGAAEDVSEPARAYLREGAELRRAADEDLLDRKVKRQVRTTWASLLRLADARVRLERTRAAGKSSAVTSAGKEGSHAPAVIRVIDQRISEHVAALTRALTAVDAARAAEVSLDDTALRSVETVGESLDQVSRAIVDDV
jgi:MFS family permease